MRTQKETMLALCVRLCGDAGSECVFGSWCVWLLKMFPNASMMGETRALPWGLLACRVPILWESRDERAETLQSAIRRRRFWAESTRKSNPKYAMGKSRETAQRWWRRGGSSLQELWGNAREWGWKSTKKIFMGSKKWLSRGMSVTKRSICARSIGTGGGGGVGAENVRRSEVRKCEILEGQRLFGGVYYCVRCFWMKHRLLVLALVERWSEYWHFERTWLCGRELRCAWEDVMDSNVQDLLDSRKREEASEQSGEGSVTYARPPDGGVRREWANPAGPSWCRRRRWWFRWGRMIIVVERRGSGTLALAIVEVRGVMLVVRHLGIHKNPNYTVFVSRPGPLVADAAVWAQLKTSFERVRTVIAFKGARGSRFRYYMECKTTLLRYWNKLWE